MSTFAFLSFLNQLTPQMQANALQLADGNMELARQIYQATAGEAMRLKTEALSPLAIENRVDEIMKEVSLDVLV